MEVSLPSPESAGLRTNGKYSSVISGKELRRRAVRLVLDRVERMLVAGVGCARGSGSSLCSAGQRFAGGSPS